MLNIILGAVGAILNVLDYISTKLCLDTGKSSELNPLLKKAMDHIGQDKALFIAKAMAICAIGYITFFLPSYTVLLVVIDILYLVVVINNVKVYFKVK